MGPITNQYVDQYQGLSVPTDDRLPWNPWSAKEFHFQENKNYGNWQGWNYFCFENSNNENRQTLDKFRDPGCFSSAIGSSGEIQTNSGVRGMKQAITFRNIFNKNPAKHFRKFNAPMDGFSRKRNHKNLKRYHRPSRVLNQIATDATVNSSLESRQQNYKSWSHVPVFEWSQSNLPPRSAEERFQNTGFRSGTFNQYSKTPGLSYNLSRNEFTTARNFSGTTSEATASRAYFKSDNYSTRRMSNAVPPISYAKCLSGANIDGIGKKVNSATSNNSENFKEDDDVIYLFSVDSSSEGKIILQIDLQSDGENLISDSSSSKAPETENEDDQSFVIIEEPEVNKPLTRKRKLSTSNDGTSKRANYRPRCAACKRNYDDVTAKKENMFISSSCFHVFCGPCISKNEKSKVCPVCEIKFMAFRKLYV